MTDIGRIIADRERIIADRDDSIGAMAAWLRRREAWIDAAESELAALRAELTKSLAAYDDEVIGRREEVTRCHAELGKLRAENERLRAADEAWRTALSGRLIAERDEWEARAEAAEQAKTFVQSRLAELEKEVEQLTEDSNLHRTNEYELGKEVKRLRATVDRANAIGDKYCEMYRAEQSRLATATELLRRGQHPFAVTGAYEAWDAEVSAFLANQPAAPTRTEDKS